MKFKSTFKFNYNQIKRNILISLSLGYTYQQIQKKKQSNRLLSCGIIGYIGKEPTAVQVCVEGIQVLQFRGYDSCGISIINEETKEIETCKYATEGNICSKTNNEVNDLDCIVKLSKEAPLKLHQSCIGIGHTRWATHGKKISLNAHPHLDNSGKIALVHNGIIDNFKEIKEYLLQNGVELKSETDTEVIVQLIGLFYSKGMSFKDAVKETLEKHVIGTYALLIINKDEPNKILATRNGSPLLVGVGKDFYIISSDSYAFQRYTSDYFMIESREIVEISSDMKLHNIKILQASVEEIYKIPLKGYDCFMIQEIMEQPETLKRAMNFGSRFRQINNNNFEVQLGGLVQYKDYLLKGKNLMIIATGTSYFASLFVSNLFRKFEIFNTVQVIDACEFNENYIPFDNPIAIFVSQSGESKDVLDAFNIVKSKGIICIGVVNKVESSLAKEVLCGVFVNAGREISVASTKAFSGQFVCLTLVALFFFQIKNESKLFILIY